MNQTPMDQTNGSGQGRRLRRNVVAVGAAACLTLGGLGIAGARTIDATTAAVPADADKAGKGGPGHFDGRRHLDAAAKALGVSEADLQAALQSGQSVAQVAQSKGIDVKVVVDALVAEAKARLAEAVKAGRVTQAQADEWTASLEQRITEMVNSPGGPHHGKGGPGRGGPHGPGLEVAAKAIGISEADLETALRSGQSIAQVAKSKGVDVKVVIDAMVAHASANLEKRITEMVNRPGDQGPPHGGPGGPHGPGDPGGPGGPGGPGHQGP